MGGVITSYDISGGTATADYTNNDDSAQRSATTGAPDNLAFSIIAVEQRKTGLRSVCQLWS